MISKLSETIENLSNNKKYIHCNTTITSNSCNNHSEIPRSNNTHLAPPRWDILSTTTDTTTTSDNERSISVVSSISTEEQLLEVRSQKDVQFKKKLEEKPDTYQPNTWVT